MMEDNDRNPRLVSTMLTAVAPLATVDQGGGLGATVHIAFNGERIPGGTYVAAEELGNFCQSTIFGDPLCDGFWQSAQF
ncbi:MAG: hypothetical protein GXY83_31070 [Rhodopirellula sp.]|nr:hypothetical protein [Rhodopirellula sp.]